MTYDFLPADIDILSRTVFGEARGEDYEGMKAVAHVILNRWKSTKGQFAKDDTIATACLRHKQLSAWNMGDPNMAAMIAVDLNSARFRLCTRATLEAFDEPDFTNGALHYHTVAMGWPAPWGEKHEPCYINAGHVFYNSVR